MKTPAYVVKFAHSANWHYRRDVPPDIRPFVKVTRWCHSLETAVLREAAIEAARYTHRYNELIRDNRTSGKLTPEKAELTPEEAERVKKVGGEDAFVSQITDHLDAAEKAERDARYVHSFAELDGPVVGSDPFAVAARDLLASTRSASPSPTEARAKIKALKAEAESFREAVAEDAPLATKLRPASPLATKLADLPTSPDTATLSHILSAWEKARKPANANQYAVPVRSFEALHGRLLLKKITKAHIREFRDHLAEGGLKQSTASKHFRCLKSLFRFAVEEAHLESSPAESIGWIREKRKFSEAKDESRRTLTVDEIQRLLAACDALPKNNHSKQDTAWFIRAALWTGARPEELAQLTPGDIAEVNGVMCFRIHDRMTHQKLKNRSSMRDVPIHQALVDLGFLKFTETRKAQRLLFPTLKADGKDRLYTRMQRRWSRLLRNQAKIIDPRVVPYSTRHTFKDALRLNETPQYIEDRLMGHTSPDRRIADGYGSAQVANLNKWLQKVDLLDKARSVSGFDDEGAETEEAAE
ncbi:Tyrosine+recombinase+XerC [Methylocapsa aurea]|uniref:phage integrase SAM-like domain-containing protein n=1 Tax=Methylocapsa aurea TaxID=663610 RepID=UPI003D1896B8